MIYKVRTNIFNKNTERYLKVLLKTNVILLIGISAIISNIYTLYINSKYNKFYENTPDTISGEAVVIEDKIEKEYTYTYIIKMKTGRYKNKNFILSVTKDKDKLKYGDLIKLEGEYISPSKSRNYKGFNYRDYLKTKKIYGTIKISNNKIYVLQKNKLNFILMKSNNIRNIITEKSLKILPEETNGLLIGILLGGKKGVSEEVIEDFKISNLSHMLSVSGAHTAYIIMGLNYVLNKSKISKKWICIIIILILCLFMFITNFTTSVIRACLMGIIAVAAKIFYKKSDIITNISFSLLITLIINPFSIKEIGLQLSYLGTLGIILFNKNIKNLLLKLKINKKIANLLSVTFSAQVMIMPIMALKFNNISLTFFISNLLASPILGAIMILGFITILVSFISFNLAKLLAVILNLLLKSIVLIAKLISKLPFSNIVIKTPYTISIILLYILILIFNYIYTIYNSKIHLRRIQKRIIKIVRVKNIVIFFSLIIALIILFNSFSYLLVPKNLKVYFIDVGQGDSCLIITPENKKILIDGGEGNPEVLLSYLLDRRIITIDYLIVSHFDSDHCNGLIEVIKKLNIKNIVISKQAYFCDEYINIANIINSKKINVIHVKQEDNIKIDKTVYLKILYPLKKLEYDDLNNNSIVAKITYNEFSILFTGDIEEKAEKKIVKLYSNSDKLKSTILKVAHHGSKTSSTQDFLNLVKPKIALIGVGKNNKFGHPNQEVLKRFSDIKCKIYRTDLHGEINVYVTSKGKMKLRTN